MGADSEILSELVPTLGGGLNPFSLNVQTFLCFSGTLVPRGLHVQRTTCTVSDHSCSCERPDGPLHVQAPTVQKARSYRPQANWGGQLLLMNWGRKSHFKRIGPRESVGAHPCTCKSLLLQAASVFRAMGAGLTVQRVTCTCMGAGLGVRRVL